MKTTSFKVKSERKVQELDATGQSIGRLASKIALLLQGKHKTSYTPNMDTGDFVVVSNINKIKFSGKKLEQKKYYRYSGYPGGLRTTGLKKMYAEKPEEVLIKIVLKMLPKNRLQKSMISRLSFKS
jgi:large subunit ribosomal protein L13